ncbi:MAG: helix-hairpin-helix domain-containing protein [Bacteroidota bacterium]|nr:helix-hairpin-helix domain-containing protein [Bacteroidota bacterium]
MKKFAADYFDFTRRDRIAIISLAVLVTGIFFLPELISNNAGSKPPVTDTSWFAAIKKIELQETFTKQHFGKRDEDNSTAYQYDRSRGNYNPKPKRELFNFDPNSLSTEGWQKLGLREKTIRTIQNYLAKGGQFRKPEDLQQIYGLFPDEYERIAPYIKIESSYETNSYKDFDKTPVENKAPKTFTGRYSVIDINSADTTAFIALPGIGNKLANRIINFRDKLGGFYSINQVGETFGLPDSTFQKIMQWLKLENTSIRKININAATLEELKAHPYIRWNLANPIIAYRDQHGAFGKVEDLKKIMIITDDIYNKMLPYLTIEK